MDALLDRARTALGGERSWLPELARRAVDVYPGPPRDALAELIRAVTEPVPDRPAAIGVALVVTPRWPVAPLPDVGSVAELLGLTSIELDWFADVRRLERHAGDERLRHYRYRWVAKAGRTPRLVEAPKPRLRAMQRRLLRSVLDPVPPSGEAHGFVRGRSVVSSAAPHTGRAVLLHLDLETFFGSIPVARVAGLFRSLGYRRPVAQVLAALTTNSTPAAVRRAMPPTSPELANVRWRLGRRLAGPHLPQGAPTSPSIANLLCYRLDRRLAGLAASYDATYTRYADDLVFSGDHGLRAARRFAEEVRQVVRDEGFLLSPTKTRLATAGQRQVVCGVVVNERVNAPRAEFDRLKAILHSAGHTGLAAQNREGLPHFRDHLRGRIAWLAARSPERGRRLAAVLDVVPD